MSKAIQKSAWEEIVYYFQFRRSDGQGWLNESETLSSAEVLVYDSAGQDVAASLVSNVAVYADTYVICKFKGGTAGQKYSVCARVVTSNGQKLQYPQVSGFVVLEVLA
ncbi:MAG: hypothetical protein EHM79_02205 [Geobacter sp.]|nr:MAG: hypothetical protein EHM79_02205 [Geobacter sp.]